ncbi:MAG TPA: MarR family transcriptional regulator [Actinophytocola sp.]|uniref:MarR family transcriptional regulator n=1 Tax=Actinophytocola sp. TaxID=1872138 RepID=UPI002DBCC5CD|nr:MarR family transcriptional regulator [Actinophytocola sp.]HEU5469683.1 MarR family transcriptional regulator [Actinophytocola sp.]
MAQDQDQGSDAELAQLLRQLVVETDRFAEMFGAAHGMHRTDLNALTVIMDAARRGAPMSPSQLAAALHLSASATTAVLDRLEAAGHLHRDRDPTDRRRVELVMADHAMQLGQRFFTPLGAELAEAWATLTARERRTIARFLAASIDATVRVRTRLVQPRP